MKALLGIVGGFVLTLAVFASGLGFATWLLAAKPVHQATPAIGISELWTKDAKPVDPARQDLERIPAHRAPATTAAKAAGGSAALAASEPAPQGQAQSAPQAGAAQAAEQPAQQAADDLPAAHLEWCANRYRSYRPEENSYRSYSGELRPCVSPYLDPGRTASIDRGAMPAQDATTDDQAEAEGYASSRDGYATTYGDPPQEGLGQEQAPEDQALGEVPQLSADHVDSCFSRYRSYRPEDNSYQPYDGGPRRQCE